MTNAKAIMLSSLAFMLMAVPAYSGDETPAPISKKTPAKRIALFFTGNHHSRCDFEAARRLAKAGFAVNQHDWPGLQGPALTWDRLRQYNVIVLAGMGMSNADMTLTDKNRTNIRLLTRFITEGGGILFIPTWVQRDALKPPQLAFAKPLGCDLLFDEMPFDPNTSVRATAWNINFALTRNALAGSALTKNFSALWYPVGTHAGAQNHTTLARFSQDWTIAIKGSLTSSSSIVPTGLDTGKIMQEPPQGTYSSEVPLAAHRKFGKGRIVYFAVSPEYMYENCSSTTLEGIVAGKGLRNIPSSGFTFFIDALRWLAEPSLGANNLGGAKHDTALETNAFKTKFGKPFNWANNPGPPAVQPASPGLIGARTAFSTGTGSVKEWSEAARQAGLAYLVFLEEFAALTPEKFARLKQQCREQTSRDFAAIPGFTIDDQVGNHYFYFGTAFPWPDKKFLTADGKHFASYDPGLDKNNPRLAGQLSATTLGYAYSTASFKLTAGNYLLGRDSSPFANFFCNWDAFASIVSQNGILVEDATRDALRLAAAGQGVAPIAIDFMDSPGQVAKSPWRTVLRLQPGGKSAVGTRLFGANMVAAYWDTWRFYPDNPSRIYITSGPEILSWSFVGPRDYAGNRRGDFVYQDLRWKVHGRVKSEVGLKEVAIYDGEKLFRRFLPGGARDYAVDLDLPHDKQHYLVLVATDLQGKRAYSQEHWDRNHRLEEFNCGDRNNQLSYGYLTNSKGYGIQLGGNQPLATPNKRVDRREISPSGTFKNDKLLGAPAFDGGAWGEPVFFMPMNLRTKKGELQAPSVCEARRLLHTGDVNIGEGRYEHRFTDNIRIANVWHTLWKTEPAIDFTLVKRNHFINIDPDSPLAVFVWEARLTLKQDLPNNGILAGFIRTGEASMWALRSSDGLFNAGVWVDSSKSRNRTLNVPFEPGAFAAMLDSPLGSMAVFPLSRGLRANLELPQARHNNLRLTLPQAKSPQKAGETVDISLLLLGIPRSTAYSKGLSSTTTETVSRFWRDFGLDGGKTGYKVARQSGTITGQRYILDIDGKAEGCFSGVITGDLVSSLPVRVAGLNDNWTACLYDRDLKQSRPIGLLEGKAWTRLYVHGSKNIFIGHPVLADSDKVFIALVQTGPSAWLLEVHNPTNAPLTTTLHANPRFDPLKGKLAGETIEIPAGQSVRRELK